MLSVVLPNYNHARLIPDAMGALLAQELLPDEIIIIDDCSTDDSLAVIEHFAAISSSVRILVNTENCGPIAALDRGLKAARGRYIYFAAADDFIMPGFFALAVSVLQANADAGLFCGEALLMDGPTGRNLAIRPPVRPIHHLGLVNPSRMRQLLVRSDNWILTGCAVFRRNAAITAGGFDKDLGSFADSYLARKVALAHGFCYAPRLVAAWRLYPNSMSRRTVLDADKARAILQAIIVRLENDSVFPAWYSQVFRNRWRFAIARQSINAEPINHLLLQETAGLSPLDRRVLGAMSALPTSRFARVAMLAWLWLRLRPTTLTGLLRTALARYFEGQPAPVRQGHDGR